MGYLVSKYAGITLKLKKPLAGLKKIGRLITSHRYNRLLLLPSGPGRVQQELVV